MGSPVVEWFRREGGSCLVVLPLVFSLLIYKGKEMAEIQMTQKEYDEKVDKIKVCGVNRGPHKYIPVSWSKTDTAEHVEHIMCMVCFTRVNTKLLFKEFPEAKI